MKIYWLIIASLALSSCVAPGAIVVEAVTATVAVPVEALPLLAGAL